MSSIGLPKRQNSSQPLVVPLSLPRRARSGSPFSMSSSEGGASGLSSYAKEMIQKKQNKPSIVVEQVLEDVRRRKAASMQVERRWADDAMREAWRGRGGGGRGDGREEGGGRGVGWVTPSMMSVVLIILIFVDVSRFDLVPPISLSLSLSLPLSLSLCRSTLPPSLILPASLTCSWPWNEQKLRYRYPTPSPPHHRPLPFLDSSFPLPYPTLRSFLSPSSL